MVCWKKVMRRNRGGRASSRSIKLGGLVAGWEAPPTTTPSTPTLHFNRLGILCRRLKTKLGGVSGRVTFRCYDPLSLSPSLEIGREWCVGVRYEHSIPFLSPPTQLYIWASPTPRPWRRAANFPPPNWALLVRPRWRNNWLLCLGLE